MARVATPTPEEEAAWREWVAARPDAVHAVAELFEPWSLFRMKPTGQRVVPVAFSEADPDDGDAGRVTVRVRILAEFNAVAFERDVFGVDPDDLEPCEPPGPDEPVGSVFTDPADIDAYVDAIRPAVLAACSMVRSCATV